MREPSGDHATGDSPSAAPAAVGKPPDPGAARVYHVERQVADIGGRTPDVSTEEGQLSSVWRPGIAVDLAIRDRGGTGRETSQSRTVRIDDVKRPRSIDERDLPGLWRCRHGSTTARRL